MADPKRNSPHPDEWVQVDWERGVESEDLDEMHEIIDELAKDAVMFSPFVPPTKTKVHTDGIYKFYRHPNPQMNGQWFMCVYTGKHNYAQELLGYGYILCEMPESFKEAKWWIEEGGIYSEDFLSWVPKDSDEHPHHQLNK
jgi:hypothetical protein